MWRIIGVTVFAVVLVSVLAGSAIASNWLGLTAGSDSTVTFSQYYLTTDFHDAFHWSDVNNVEPTDISTTLYHEASGKEVEIWDNDYGETEWAGGYVCETESGTVCLKGIVYFNLYYGPYSPTQERHLACQEVGHAVGLDHSSEGSSCMKPAAYSNTSFTSHDDGEVNAKY